MVGANATAPMAIPNSMLTAVQNPIITPNSLAQELSGSHSKVPQALPNSKLAEPFVAIPEMNAKLNEAIGPSVSPISNSIVDKPDPVNTHNSHVQGTTTVTEPTAHSGSSTFSAHSFSKAGVHFPWDLKNGKGGSNIMPALTANVKSVLTKNNQALLGSKIPQQASPVNVLGRASVVTGGHESAPFSGVQRTVETKVCSSVVKYRNINKNKHR